MSMCKKNDCPPYDGQSFFELLSNKLYNKHNAKVALLCGLYVTKVN